jgi:predicted metal-dependent hydrolase
VPNQTEAFRLLNGRLQMLQGLGDDSRHALVAWYASRLKRVLPERMPAITVAVGNSAKSFRVQDLGYRWGSCGKGDVVYFHWKVALLPLQIIDYVIAHELVHLQITHHTPDFWKALERSMPDFQQRRDWLAKHGTETDGY